LLTLYASFATSSNPSGEQLDGNGISYDGIAAQTQNLAPERNRAWEGGVKWETPDGNLLLTAAAFQITKANARENIGGNVYELVGKLRSRGVELGVNGTLFDTCCNCSAAIPIPTPRSSNR
jgi:catecholate siderophore receptor